MTARLLGVAGAMLALLAAGLSTGTRIYYGLFFTLLLLVIYALVSTLWILLSVRVRMKGVRARVARGERLMIILSVRHSCPLPAGSLRLTLSMPGGGGAQEVSIQTPPYREKNYRNVIACPHRGSYEAGVLSIGAGDLFGLFNLRRGAQQKLVRVEVYPNSQDVAALPLQASDTGPEFISRAVEDNASPSDIRKWQDGDELKKIHWKLSLRKRELMVRTFEESARPDTLVIPDLSEITALTDLRKSIEDVICEAALSAVKAQLGAGYPVCMPLRARQPQELNGKSTAELGSFTDALMRVEFDAPYPYEQVLMLMTQRLQRTGGAVLITGKLTTRVADIAMRMRQSGAMVKLIWVTDAPRSESLEMLERLKMAGADVESVNPLSGGYTVQQSEAQAGLDTETIFDA